MSSRSDSDRPRRGLWRKALPAFLVVGAAAAVGVIWAALPAKDETAAPKDRPPVNVHVEVVEAAKDVPDTFALAGSVEPYLTVKVAAEVSGRVEAYAGRSDPPTETGEPAWATNPGKRGQPIEEGDRIEAGHPILYLNTDLLKAAHDQTKAQLEYDQRELAAIRKLLAKEVAADLEVEQKQTQVSLAEARLSQAEAQLKRAAIHAPAGGVLNRSWVEEGEYVQPGAPVAEIVQTHRVKVVVDVPERDIGFLNVGDRHRIFDKLAGNLNRDGEITYISELADPGTRTTRIEMTVDNREGRLRSGQIVRVQLTRRVLPAAILIPLDAVIPRETDHPDADTGAAPEGKYTVYVVENGQAVPREVEIDLRFVRGRRIRVESGLHDGDRLIVKGHRLCGPGQKVKEMPPEAAAAGETVPAPARQGRAAEK